MRTMGLLGKMSWESSIKYYRIIHETVREKLGGLHSAKSTLYSVDFAEMEAVQHQGKRQDATRLMITAARQIEEGGAGFLVICTNTMQLHPRLRTRQETTCYKIASGLLWPVSRPSHIVPGYCWTSPTLTHMPPGRDRVY